MRTASVKLRKHLMTVTAPVKPTRLYWATNEHSGELDVTGITVYAARFESAPWQLSVSSFVSARQLDYGKVDFECSPTLEFLQFFNGANKVNWMLEASDGSSTMFSGCITEIEQACLFEGSKTTVRVRLTSDVDCFYDVPSKPVAVDNSDMFRRQETRHQANTYGAMLRKVTA